MARPSGMAVTVVLVGLLLSAQSMTVFGIRGMGELRPKANSTSLESNNSSTSMTWTNYESEQERVAKVESDVLRTVEDSTADAGPEFSTERMQMEQSGWSCSGKFSGQDHAWYCAGRSAY